MTNYMTADPLPQDLQFFRDNDVQFTVEIKEGDSYEAKDLTAWEGWFAVKDRDTYADAQILIMKRTDVVGEGEKTATTGEMRFYVVRTDTADLKAGMYFWDVGIWQGSTKITAAKGQLELKQPVLLGDVPV